MDEVIEELRERAEQVPVPLTLPDEDDLVLIEEALFLSLPDEYREFLLEASDVVFGSLEPATVTDEQSHTYLPEMAANAWDAGLSRELIPICESPDGFYAVAEDGKISFHPQYFDGGHREIQAADEDQEWLSIWAWVREVWLES